MPINRSFRLALAAATILHAGASVRAETPWRLRENSPSRASDVNVARQIADEPLPPSAEPPDYGLDEDSRPISALGSEPSPAPGAPGKNFGGQMSLTEFEQLAISSSPALAEASARVAAARGRWIQAGLYPNPLVGYSGQQLGSGGQAEQQGVLVEQEFVTAHKLRKAREVAGWEVNRARQEFEAVRFRVLTDVRVGFYETLFAQRRQMVVRDLLSITERVVISAQQLLDAGEAGKPDVLRAKIERDTVLIDLQNVENRLEAAWRRLAAAAGAPNLVRVPLAGEPEEAIREISWDDALQSILSQSPELGAARAAVQTAAWQVQLERARVYPNLTVQGIVQHDEAIEGTNGNLQATVPIPLFNRNQGAIREALAEQVAAEAAVDRTALRLQRDLGLVYERYASAQFQARKYANELLPNARETLDLVQQGYDAGEIAFIDLLTAQRTYSQVYLSYIDAQRELWIATAQIDGLLLGESLGGVP